MIGIINTSTATTDYLDHDYDIRTARMRVIMEGKEYMDFVELTAPEFFSKIRNDHSITPTTSTPNMYEFEELIKELENEGCTEILILTISSQLSNCFSIATQVKEQYEGKARIEVFDTFTAAIQEAMFSVEACEMRKDGKSLDEIIERLYYIRKNNRILFVVDSLRQLVRNGRLSNAAGFVGNLLKIKPFLHVDDEGKIVTVEKVRTSKKALQAMVDHFFSIVRDVEDFKITFITSDHPEGEEFVRKQILARYPDKEFYQASLTPVIGCHTAEGVVGVGYVIK